MSSRRRVLVTGPIGRTPEYAAAAEAAGWEATVCELIAVHPRPLDATQLPESVDCLCVTSKHAHDALKELPLRFRSVGVAAVGELTAERTVDLGFSLQLKPARNAEELAQSLKRELKPGSRLLWLRGSLSDELACDLRQDGFEVLDPVAYETVCLPAGSEDPDPTQVQAIFFASPSAVGAFATRFSAATSLGEVTAIAMGSKTAESLRSSGLEFDGLEFNSVCTLENSKPTDFTRGLRDLATR